MKSACLFTFFLFACFATNAQTQDTKKVVINKDTLDIIFMKVEVEAEYPGGLPAWQTFLADNLIYPKKAVRKNVEGTVILQFIVCTDGTVCNVEAISGPELLREAAVKAFKATPNWVPASHSGRKVKSYKKQPITFRLE